MLVVPYAHDQPDNARRVSKLRIGRTLSRRSYTAERVAAKLGQLLGDRGAAIRAERAGAAVRADDGVTAACDAIEATVGAFVR